LVAINIVFLIMGCFLDTVPILLAFVPLLMPTVKALGIDAVHFGVITVFNLLIGLVIPPYGLTMFLLCRMASGVFRGCHWTLRNAIGRAWRETRNMTGGSTLACARPGFTVGRFVQCVRRARSMLHSSRRLQRPR
jgi:hypothetical protein